MDSYSPAVHRGPKPLIENPLNKLTMREIVYMSRQLQLTPSQLFKLPERELEERVNACLRSSSQGSTQQANNDNNNKVVAVGNYRWRNVNEMRGQLMAERQENRLKGGEMPIYPGLWAILTQAAYEIEAYIKDVQSGAPIRSACSP